jgi:hypothetical protein
MFIITKAFEEGAIPAISDNPEITKKFIIELAKNNISTAYLHPGDPDFAERLAAVREIQFARWEWAVSHMPDFVNMLRITGHVDEKIQRMLKGIPFCFENELIFDDFRRALKTLAHKLETDLKWKHVCFVFTGSCVPGFSQNPLKGLRNIPSKITDPGKSDVDICIIADGVSEWLTRNNITPKLYSTTCTRNSSGTRLGVKHLETVNPVLASFFDEWSKKFGGGMQITFCEDGLDIPPWEMRVDLNGV